MFAGVEGKSAYIGNSSKGIGDIKFAETGLKMIVHIFSQPSFDIFWYIINSISPRDSKTTTFDPLMGVWCKETRIL